MGVAPFHLLSFIQRPQPSYIPAPKDLHPARWPGANHVALETEGGCGAYLPAAELGAWPGVAVAGNAPGDNVTAASRSSPIAFATCAVAV